MISVLIADDHPVVRIGLAQIIGEESDMRTDEVRSIPELRAYLAQRTPDVLLLDVSMPGGSGLEMVSEIARNHSSVAVLVVSALSEEAAGPGAIMAGAAGYLNKDIAPEELVRAIRTIADGKRYVSSELGAALAGYLQRAQAVAPHETLSARELTVLLKIAEGKSTSEIAEDLNLSPKTVSTFRARLLEKMHMSSTAELTRYVVEHKLAAKG